MNIKKSLFPEMHPVSRTTGVAGGLMAVVLFAPLPREDVTDFRLCQTGRNGKVDRVLADINFVFQWLATYARRDKLKELAA